MGDGWDCETDGVNYPVVERCGRDGYEELKIRKQDTVVHRK